MIFRWYSSVKVDFVIGQWPLKILQKNTLRRWTRVLISLLRRKTSFVLKMMLREFPRSCGSRRWSRVVLIWLAGPVAASSFASEHRRVMCLFWKAEKIALKNSVKNCGGVLSRTFSLSKAQVHKTKDPISRRKGWLGEFSFMLKKMLRWWWCFRNEEKTSQRSTWLIKVDSLVFFPTNHFYMKNL